MKKHKFYFQLIQFGIVLLGCLGTVQAQSAKQGSISINPASIDAKVKSGASHTQTFTITNETAVRLKFRCSVEDIGYDEKNNRLSGRPGTLPRSASLWMQFTPSEVIIEPFSAGTVKAVITVPHDAAGSYYTVPVFEGMPVEKTNLNVSQNTNSAVATIGIKFRGLMLFTTESGAEYNLEVLNSQISPPTASSGLEINLNLRNRGTAHVRVRGAFAILNASGQLVGRGSIDEKRYLPTQTDIIKGKWSDTLPPGNYTSVVTLSHNRVGMEPFSLVYEIPFTVSN